MTYGYSRDDVGSFLPTYLGEGIIPKDPFQELDQDGGQFPQLEIWGSWQRDSVF